MNLHPIILEHVEREHGVERIDDMDRRGDGGRLSDTFRRRVADGDGIDAAGRDHGGHAVPPDPAGAKEPETRLHRAALQAEATSLSGVACPELACAGA